MSGGDRDPKQRQMGRAARSLVVLLPLLHVAWCDYSYTGFAVPEGMKTAVFAGGTACVRRA